MNNLNSRRYTLIMAMAIVAAVFVIRLFSLQVLSPEFSASAQRNVVKRIVMQPARGIIYDRNGEQYVTNEPIFDLTVTPSELQLQDTNLLLQYLPYDKPELQTRLASAYDYSRLKPSLLANHIKPARYAQLQEHLWRFPGLHTVVRNTRSYQAQVGANVLGYINEVNKRDIERSQQYYAQGDLIGRSGFERAYEQVLRGRKGVQKVLKDVHGREVGPFAGGALDTLPQKGQDVMISLDLDLQRYAELLMRGKVGSVVAIEPASGEILSFVSSPTYEPDHLLTGNQFGQHYRQLERAPLLPLFNRPLQAQYPPGSIFKTIAALAGLQEGTLFPHTFYGCAGGFMRNGGTPGCHGHPSPLNLPGAIQHSCNAYFAAAYVDFVQHSKFSSYEEGYRTWYNYMRAFGLGAPLGVDIPNETAGSLWSAEMYNKRHGQDRWGAYRTLSNSIGQGEVLMTPLQMANMAAIIANRGHYITPHFFKGVYRGQTPDSIRFQRHDVPIKAHYFDLVVDAMQLVVDAGTGIGAQVPGTVICGKTGTSQNPHGADHSVFIAFAPKDNPQIAIAVVVENAGFGGTWAAPIAGLLIDQYLNDTVSNPYRQDYITNQWFVPPALYFAHEQPLTPAPAPEPADAAVPGQLVGRRE